MKRSKNIGDDVRRSLVQTAGPYTRSRDLSGFGMELGEFSKTESGLLYTSLE